MKKLEEKGISLDSSYKMKSSKFLVGDPETKPMFETEHRSRFQSIKQKPKTKTLTEKRDEELLKMAERY